MKKKIKILFAVMPGDWIYQFPEYWKLHMELTYPKLIFYDTLPEAKKELRKRYPKFRIKFIKRRGMIDYEYHMHVN